MFLRNIKLSSQEKMKQNKPWVNMYVIDFVYKELTQTQSKSITPTMREDDGRDLSETSMRPWVWRSGTTDAEKLKHKYNAA